MNMNSRVIAAGSPAAGEASGCVPDHRTPKPKQNARCSAERDDPAAMTSHPVSGGRQKTAEELICIENNTETDRTIFILSLSDIHVNWNFNRNWNRTNILNILISGLVLPVIYPGQ